MRRLVSYAVAATTLATALVGAASTQAATPAPLRYVAMGDSYSAASGVLPLDPAAPLQCLRSTRNFAHVLAAATRTSLTDATCGAADTGDYREAQYPGVPPQLDALRRDTQLVTMTIGGNDSSVFISTILQCGTAGLLALGQGRPCKDQYGSSFQDTIRTTTYPAVVQALRDVRRRAPQARVAILGYPWIMPKAVGCFDRMPIATGDVPYVRAIQATLNDAVRRAAAAAGATYVDLNTVSDGHDACQPLGVRWVEPVLQGTNAVIVHPNALGEARMAEQVRRVLRLR